MKLAVPAREWEAADRAKDVQLTAIPYFLWANREVGYMNVWLATDERIALDPPEKEVSGERYFGGTTPPGKMKTNGKGNRQEGSKHE